MSRLALQRVVVRMLWDPELADRVYASPSVALAGDDLTPEELAWLTRPDRRAWSTDPNRRARTLHGLIEEFPASAALAARHEKGLFHLDRFFSSTTFHACVRDGASLALAFGAFLGREVSALVGDRRVRVLAAVEGEVARLRRADPHRTSGGEVSLRPGARVFDAPSGSALLLAEVVARIARHPHGIAAAIASREIPFDGLPAVGPDHAVESLLAIAAPGGDVAIEPLAPALAAVLRAAAAGASLDALQGIARAQGADPGEDREVLDGLLADGLLVRA